MSRRAEPPYPFTLAVSEHTIESAPLILLALDRKSTRLNSSH